MKRNHHRPTKKKDIRQSENETGVRAELGAGKSDSTTPKNNGHEAQKHEDADALTDPTTGVIRKRD